MSVLFTLELDIEPDEVERYLGQFPDLLPDTRAFDGCEGISVHQDESDPTKVILLEHWASREHHERYLAWRQERGDSTRLRQGLSGEPVGRYYTSLDL